MRLARVLGLALGALLALHVSDVEAADQAISTPVNFSGLIAIDAGRKLYLDCQGEDSPTVILEAGLRTAATFGA
jgi:hypothetical protein